MKVEGSKAKPKPLLIEELQLGDMIEYSLPATGPQHEMVIGEARHGKVETWWFEHDVRSTLDQTILDIPGARFFDAKLVVL